jgi:hypothetical protein
MEKRIGEGARLFLMACYIFLATNLMMPEALKSGDLVPALPECDFKAVNVQVGYRANRCLNKHTRIRPQIHIP